ncbi:MAG: hypothetical protein MJZ38_01580 [archaeon]|nr:hypothetical protein [archaeon]
MKRPAIGSIRIPPKLRQWLTLNPGWDQETKQDKLDRFIFRCFPAFVVTFAVIAIVLFILDWGEHSTPLAHLLYSLCVSYTAGFVILGLPVVVLSEHTVFKRRYVIPILFGLATLLGLVLWFVFGDNLGGPNKFISGFIWFIHESGLDITMYTVILGLYVLLTCCLLASYGVIAVVVAYFRKNYHRVLLSLEKNDDSKLCRKARGFFMIPSVIDVTEVTIEPELDDTVLQKAVFLRLFGYEMVIGLVIASYLFLNPVFLGTIPYAEMMVIIMLLSLFVSVMVIPVSIVRSLGAKAHSAGNRPITLWENARDKLFHPSFYIALFLTLLWISLYTNMDGLRILTHYTGYIVFMACLSALVSFTYINTFYVPFKNGIVRNFYLRKKQK